ncbi:MAG: hypothetical protein GAK40_00343 [Burkholderia plantarii]|nr:MAG: hypothetical protein GAK40_00343 [Burkholderia plantarii]
MTTLPTSAADIYPALLNERRQASRRGGAPGAYRRFARAACSFLATLLVAGGSAQAADLVVPAYFYPSGTGATAWSTLATNAASVPITAIVNPNSGPGTAVDPAYTSAIAKVRAAGGKVIAYVHTSYGSRSLSDVTADINRYLAYYTVDGFFIDEMANDSTTAHVQYYQSLYNYIKGLSANYQVVNNPGANLPEIYASLPVADRFVVYEDQQANYASYTRIVAGQLPGQPLHPHRLQRELDATLRRSSVRHRARRGRRIHHLAEAAEPLQRAAVVLVAGSIGRGRHRHVQHGHDIGRVEHHHHVGPAALTEAGRRAPLAAHVQRCASACGAPATCAAAAGAAPAAAGASQPPPSARIRLTVATACEPVS